MFTCLLYTSAGNYLVNYAIGRGGDGGNRTVSDDADANIEAQKSADAETIINDAKKQMGLSAALFEEAHPAKDITICLLYTSRCV